MARSPTRFASEAIVGESLPDDIKPGYEASVDTYAEELPGESLLKQAQPATSEMLAGQVPQDVQDQVEQMSAERSLQGGFGFQGSQRARNLTARDLGLKSTDLMNEGVKNTAALSQSELGYASLREDMRRTDDQFFMALQEQNIKQHSLDLAAYNLISENQRVVLSETNKLIIQNSNKVIKNLQEHINSMLGIDGEEAFFGPDNNAIFDLIMENG